MRQLSSTKTIRTAQPKLALVILLTIIGLLSACTNNGLYPSSSSRDIDSVFDENDNYGAPALDEILAANRHRDLSQSPEIALQALVAASHEQRWEVAENLLNIINPKNYRVDSLAEYSLAASRYWLQAKEYITALRWLENSQLQNDLPLMKSQDQIGLSLARADVLYGLENYQASAKERIFIESLLMHQSDRNANAQAIWRTLIRIPVSELKIQQTRAVDPSYKAWLELALIHHTNQIDIAQQAAQAQAWRQRWPGHSASYALPESIGALQTLADNRPRAIAALLPLTGPLAQGGKAVQDGLAAAYFTALNEGWELPTLTSYDSNGQSIEQLYQQAVNNGADLIIGPLQKNKVSEFLTMPTTTPIIALNYISDGLPPPPNVIQFGLASEDEASQIAIAARDQNYRNALLIQSDADWSRRASQAFSQQWIASGGKILSNTVLTEAANYSKEIESSLLIPESHARHTRIENIIGQKIEFTPRRRHDIDVIIVFANSKQSKSIKPLLSYHYAGKLPVYSSSHVNDGLTQSNKNKDLNGIVFNEIPWVLESNEIKNHAAKRYVDNKNLGRLFAMGVDAFYLHPRLKQLQQAPDSQLNGLTGNLSLRDNRVIRELQMAKFVNGKPQKLSRTQ